MADDETVPSKDRASWPDGQRPADGSPPVEAPAPAHDRPDAEPASAIGTSVSVVMAPAAPAPDHLPVLTDEQVDQAIWSYFYQLSRSRDRRRAHSIDPVGPKGEPPPKPRVNFATGLPEREEDMTAKNMAKTGPELALEAVVPPERLAAACVQVLPDGIPDTEANWAKFGTTLAHKPRTMWTEEEGAAVRANAQRFKVRSAYLAQQGLINTRPINDRDKDMGDMPWTDEAGFSLGFSITWKGYQFMESEARRNPAITRVLHVLDFAGDEVRKQAPDWARKEWEQARK